MDLQRYQQCIETCFPELTVRQLEFFGGGSCRVFLANGSLIFRFPHGGDGRMLYREHQVYRFLAAHLSLPIPQYTYFSEGCEHFPYPVAGYHRLPGSSLSHCQLAPAQLRQVASQLGRFLSELHGIPLAAAPPGLFAPYDTRLQRARLRELYLRIRHAALPLLTREEQAWTEQLFQGFLNDFRLWEVTPVLVHGDFDSSNVLYDEATGVITGVIDFEEARPWDPATDFCALLAGFGSDFLEAVLAAYAHPIILPLRRRIALLAQCILFSELVYGVEVNDARFVENGRARLRRAMRGEEPIGDWLPLSTSATREPEGYPV